MTSPTTRFGSEAETAVASRLAQTGFSILGRNWRRPWGELDIVARKDGVLRFIEIKASTRLQQGFEPFVRADARKMARVRRTARTWMAAHGLSEETPWQMDVISVIMGTEGPVFTHFENI